MLVPPYDTLLKALGTSREEQADKTEIVIPATLLRLLLKIALNHSDFNEKGYLATNPDIAQAVKKGLVKSAKAHYIAYGYWEGRRGATPEVDEGWYRKTYPDVASAIKAGVLASAGEHYQLSGADEFRIPNEASCQECLIWQSALLQKPVAQ